MCGTLKVIMQKMYYKVVDGDGEYKGLICPLAISFIKIVLCFFIVIHKKGYKKIGMKHLDKNKMLY